jgi:Ca2+:H+ antiporter
MPAGINGRKAAVMGAIVVLTVVAGIAHFAGVAALAVFVLSGAALGGLAWIVSDATEAIGRRFGPGATGVLQSTLGNLPELFVVVFALRAGELVVAETSILGSLFANALLVLGLVLVVGARQGGGVMRFGKRLPNDATMLLMLAVFTIVLLGVATASHDPVAEHKKAVSIAGAIVLLTVYAAWIFYYLRNDEPAASEPAAGGHAGPSMAFSIALLALAGVGAAAVSDWFIAALDPAVADLGISKAFAGLVIAAIAGNAVENVVGIVLAAKGQPDLAISIVKNSVAQIAAFLYPLLILVSLLFATQLTFSLAPVYIAALLLSGLAMWQITGDGEGTVHEGLALIGLYAILAMIALYE